MSEREQMYRYTSSDIAPRDFIILDDRVPFTDLEKKIHAFLVNEYKKGNVEVKHEPIQEDTPLNVAFPDDTVEQLQEIANESEWNPWAYCCVKTTVSHKALGFVKESDYVSQVCYKNEADFVKDQGDAQVEQALWFVVKHLALTLQWLVDRDLTSA